MSRNEIGLREARQQLGDLVTAAQYGITTVITRNGRPIAMLVPFTPQESTVLTITLVSAVTGDIIAGTELGDPESRIEFHELPKAAKDWAREQGYGTDEAELIYALDDGEAVPAGFPVFVVEQATASTTTKYERTTDEGTDTIIITVTGDEVERSFLTDGVLTGGPDHDTADRLHDYLVDIKADGYREV